MRVLGVDYGRKRIGLALSDASGTLARPWQTVPRIGNPSQVARALAGIIDTLRLEGEEASAVVLGLPRRLNGEPTVETRTVERLATEMMTLVALPVILQDERLTSHEAETVLAVREKDWRKRKERLDAMAAAVILQDYLDSRERPRIEAEDERA